MKIKIPNLTLKKGEEAKIVCNKVPTFQIAYATEVGKRMISLMTKWNGCGLASPQVGLNLTMFVARIKVDGDLKNEIVINPTIIEYIGEMESHIEGCLSLPSEDYMVERYSAIRVKYFNGGRIIDTVLKGLSARIFQHEFDHLNAEMISDKGTKVKTA